jgi:hypothetical protein
VEVSLREQIVVSYRLRELGVVKFNTTNPNFNVYTTRQGTRVIVTRRRGKLHIRECLVKGLFTQVSPATTVTQE